MGEEPPFAGRAGSGWPACCGLFYRAQGGGKEIATGTFTAEDKTDGWRISTPGPLPPCTLMEMKFKHGNNFNLGTGTAGQHAGS